MRCAGMDLLLPLTLLAWRIFSAGHPSCFCAADIAGIKTRGGVL